MALRGFDFDKVINRPPPAFFDDAASIGCKLGRVFFTPAPDYTIPVNVRDSIDWWNIQLSQRKMTMVLACEPPGGITQTSPFWKDTKLQNNWVAMWKQLAVLYPSSWYDLMNEPVVNSAQGSANALPWVVIAQKACDAIRSVSQSYIVFEPSPGGIQQAFGDAPVGQPVGYGYAPPKCTNLMASLHMYWPYELTHWGVYAAYPMTPGVVWPNPANGYTKQRMAAMMARVQEWSAHYKIQIYVGEFSCVRWALNGSRDRWLSDCLECFEDYGWHWTYHAWRSTNIWSLENDSQFVDQAISGNTNNPYSKAMTLLRKRMTCGA